MSDTGALEVDDNRPICETYWYTNTRPSMTALPHTHLPKKTVEESEVLYAVEAQAPSKILLERRKRVKSKKERWAILSLPPFPLSLSTYKKNQGKSFFLPPPFSTHPPPLFFFVCALSSKRTFRNNIVSKTGGGKKSVRDWSPRICLLGGGGGGKKQKGGI